MYFAVHVFILENIDLPAIKGSCHTFKLPATVSVASISQPPPPTPPQAQVQHQLSTQTQSQTQIHKRNNQ